MFALTKKTIFLVALVIFIASPALASEFVPDTPPGQLSYLFHLYYDNGQLFADRDFEFKYDVIPDEFVPETITTQFPYKGEVINFLNQTAATFEFDPRRGNSSFAKGKISVKSPYIPDGQRAIFYDSQGRVLLTIFVRESSFCNDDAVCNFDRGEDEKTCPNDCAGATPLPSPEPESGQGGMLMIAIYVLILAGVALGGWFGWKWWKRIKETSPVQLPPTPSDQTNQSAQ